MQSSTSTGSSPEFRTLIYERPADGVVRVVMNRPQVRNAQNLEMTYELLRALDEAARDDSVKVIILAGAGPHFSAGHDLNDRDKSGLATQYPVHGNWTGFTEPGIHGVYAREQEVYLNATRKWRDQAKPTIAEVQGKCIAGGLMLAWACDLIVASDDAEFCDPVVTLGVCGVEWFVHPWELGARKAKELLLTASSWTATEGERYGMVNRVVNRAQLSETTLEIAKKIALKPTFAVKLTKQAVNKALDSMGQAAAIDYNFNLHQLCHAYNIQQYGYLLDPAGWPKSISGKPGGADSK